MKKVNTIKKRAVFADLIRTIAIIFVIIIHTTCNYLAETYYTGETLAHNVVLIIDSITSIAVVLFFMLSGCFMIKKESNIDKNLFKKIFKRIYQLIFWSTAYLFFLKYFMHYDIGLKYSLIAQFFNSQVSHLWFMYPLIALYILSPIVSKIYYSLDNKGIIYLLSLTFVIPLILKTFIQYLGFISIPIYAVGFSEFGYFILGKYIYDKRELLMKKIKIYFPILLSILGLVLIIAYAKYDMYRFGFTDKPFYDYSRFPVAVYCVSFYTIFIYLKDVLEKTHGFFKNIIHFIGKNSGGIYFIHMFVIYILGNIYIGPIGFTCNEGNIIFMLLGTLLYFIVSVILVGLLGKIPLVKELIN